MLFTQYVKVTQFNVMCTLCWSRLFAHCCLECPVDLSWPLPFFCFCTCLSYVFLSIFTYMLFIFKRVCVILPLSLFFPQVLRVKVKSINLPSLKRGKQIQASYLSVADLGFNNSRIDWPSTKHGGNNSTTDLHYVQEQQTEQ